MRAWTHQAAFAFDNSQFLPLSFFSDFRGEFASMVQLHICLLLQTTKKTRALPHSPMQSHLTTSILLQQTWSQWNIASDLVHTQDWNSLALISFSFPEHGPVERMMILSCHTEANLDFLSPFSMPYLLTSLCWAVRWKTCQDWGAGRSRRTEAPSSGCQRWLTGWVFWRQGESGRFSCRSRCGRSRMFKVRPFLLKKSLAWLHWNAPPPKKKRLTFWDSRW